MKKLSSAILFLTLALSLNAQDARQRTTETIVADVLAAMPAQDANAFDAQMADLASAAPASVAQVASMMKPAAQGVKNNLFEYALAGLSSYATSHSDVAEKVREGFRQAIKATADKTNKEFLMQQFRPLATSADAAFMKELASDPALAPLALGTLVVIPGTEDVMLAMVDEAAVDKSLLADAVARKGIASAEKALIGWAANSEGRELRAICSALAEIGSKDALNILQEKSMPDFAALATKLSTSGKSGAVAKAAKVLMNSEVSAYKTAGASALMNSNPAKALKTLEAALDAEDVPYRNAVLNMAADPDILGVQGVASALLKKYPTLSESARIDAINWLGNNKIDSAADLVCSAMDSKCALADAAIAAAGKIGGEKCLKALAAQLVGARSASAVTALASFKGDIASEVGKVLEEYVANYDIANKFNKEAMSGLFDIINERQLTGLAPQALSMLESPVEAIAALGNNLISCIARPEDAPKLGELTDGNASFSVALKRAIHSLSPEDQASKVKELMAKAAKPENFYPVLASTGTAAAVETLADIYRNTGNQKAIASLVEIDNPAVAPVILEFARKDKNLSGVAARIYPQLIARHEQSADNKINGFATALELAEGLEDEMQVVKNVLGHLGNLPTMKSFLLASSYLDNEAVVMDAAEAVKKIAGATKEEIDYATYATALKKAASAYAARGAADDEYAVKEITKLLEAAVPSPISELTPEEKKQGFEMLFDGSGLDKWQGDLKGYVPMNGTIYVSANYGSTGNLYTKKEYRNFVYRFEFCFLREGVNNGVGVRTPMGVDAAYDGMCEVQILDHDAPMYANLREYQVHGSVYGVVPAKRIVHKPLGEWSTEEIRVEGDHIKVTVNGEVIVDANIRKACKGHNVAPDGSAENPYTVDRRNHPGMFNKSGYISFCGHGEGLKIRNVRILDLGK